MEDDRRYEYEYAGGTVGVWGLDADGFERAVEEAERSGVHSPRGLASWLEAERGLETEWTTNRIYTAYGARRARGAAGAGGNERRGGNRRVRRRGDRANTTGVGR